MFKKIVLISTIALVIVMSVFLCVFTAATGSRTLIEDVLASDGRTYRVSVRYRPGSGIPWASWLMVDEIPAGSETYDDYAARSESALGLESGTAAGIRLFDIRIVDIFGNDVEPGDTVDVRIAAADTYHFGTTRLVHFSDEDTEGREVLTTLIDGSLGFATREFSVYSLVDVAGSAEPSGYVQLTTVEDVIARATEVEGAECGILISSAGSPQYYLINDWSTGGGRKYILKTSDVNDAAPYYVEEIEGATGDFRYRAYCYDNDGTTLKYVHLTQVSSNTARGNLELSSSVEDASAFRIEYLSEAGYYLISGQDNGVTYYWNQHQGNTGPGFVAYNGRSDTNAKLKIGYYHTMPDDPYNLDGQTYGLIYPLNNDSNYAMMARETAVTQKIGTVTLARNVLSSEKTVVRNDPMDSTGVLYVLPDGDITMWTFHNVSADNYRLSAVVDGVEMFLRVDGYNISLVEDPTDDANCVFRVEMGSGDKANKIRLIGPSFPDSPGVGNVVRFDGNRKISGETNVFGGDKKSNASQEWLRLAEPAVYTDTDFVRYSAKKVSVSEIENGQNVVIYTRVWNGNGYDFYIVDHNGRLLRATESGDDIVWVGTEINTTPWTFTEYYYEGTNTPNNYYELQNVYSGKYIAPQINNGQILSDNTIGVNLPGRRNGEYYSKILAWDDPHYDYAGLKADGHDRVTSTNMVNAEDYYFAIIEEPRLHTVETVDHTAVGLTMKIKNFDSREQINSHMGQSSDAYDAKKVTKGILSTDLGSDGYPTFMMSDSSQGSMSALFSDATNVNNLFISSTYYGSGYFEFDSTQNYAYLTDETDSEGNKKFRVYQELGTVDYVHGNTIKHGQFMPFNDLTEGQFSTVNPKNMYDIYAVELSDNDPRKYEKLYAVPAEDSGDPNAADYYFGVEIDAGFVQTPNGDDAWGHDIIFEFTGDDDFWLYVDGELVLDLGGIHGAVPGSVNFCTGVVVCRNSEGTNTTTSLIDIFRSNYEARGMSAAEIAARIDEIFVAKTINGVTRYVFKDYTAHTMSIFYLERGAGASNLRMRFNLSSVKPGQVQLSKVLTGTDKQDYVSVEFPFQIHYKVPKTDGSNEYEEKLLTLTSEEEDQIYVSYSNRSDPVPYQASYSVAGVSDPYEHVFFLRPGETVEINFPTDTIEYWITECAIKENIYDFVRVNDEEIPSDRIVDHGDYLDYTSTRAKVADRAQLTFENHVNPEEIRYLSITKRLFDASGNELTKEDDPTGFKYRIRLGDALEYYTMGEYHVKNPSGEYCTYVMGEGFVSTGVSVFSQLTEAQRVSATFRTSQSGAVDKIPAGYTVEIRDLMVGTKFSVTEESYDIPKGYGLRHWTEVDGNTNQPKDYVGYKRVLGSFYLDQGDTENVGIIRDRSDPGIEVHNVRGWGITANKSWSDDTYMRKHDDIYMAVYDTHSGAMVDGTVHAISHPSKSTYWFFYDLNAGASFSDYAVREVVLTGSSITVGADGAVSGYDSVTPKEDGQTVSVDALTNGQAATDPMDPYDYEVTYSVGAAAGTADNVRTDTVTNTRFGLKLIKTDWHENPADDLPIAGAVFTLQDAEGTPVGAGTYTSDGSGLITIAYINKNTEYVLTETGTPTGYQGLREPVHFIWYDGSEGHDDGIAILAGSEYCEVVQASGSAMPSIAVKNRTLDFEVRKYGVDTDGVEEEGLAGAHFALYRGVLNVNGQIRMDYRPIAGFEDLVSGSDGVIPGVDETLPAGTYFLVETRAPSGYDRASDPIRFTIDGTGMITVVQNSYGVMNESSTLGNTTYRYELRFINRINDIPVTLRKVSVNTEAAAPAENPLTGVTFNIYTTADGNVIATAADGTPLSNLTSGPGGVIFEGELAPNTYYIEEVDTPVGYTAPGGRYVLTVKKGSLRPTIRGSWDDAAHGTVTGTVTEGYTVNIWNAFAYNIPSSGSSMTYIIYIIGGLMIGLGGAGAAMLQKKENRYF